MKNLELSYPQFGFIVATRAALGVGIGLLVAGRLARRQRRRVGTILAMLGALTTIPAGFFIRRGRRAAAEGNVIAAA